MCHLEYQQYKISTANFQSTKLNYTSPTVKHWFVLQTNIRHDLNTFLYFVEIICYKFLGVLYEAKEERLARKLRLSVRLVRLSVP